MNARNDRLLDVRLPTPTQIHRRLTAIYREAAMLRRLLRLAKQRTTARKDGDR